MSILEKSPVLILMLISLFGCLSGETIKCNFIRKNASSNDLVFYYTFFISAICSSLMLAMWAFSYSVSWYTVILALLFGVAVMGQIAASAFAMRIGPWSYTTVMMSLSVVIPALAGPIFWNEKLDIFITIGIVLMLVCFVLSVKTEVDKDKKSANIKWLLLSLLSSLSTGAVGILQKLHQSSEYKSEIAVFLAISFGVCAVISLAFAAILSFKSTKNNPFRIPFTPWILLAGVGTLINHLINLYLSGAMASAIFFPLMSGGELILVTLCSVILFKERLSVKQWIGLGSGILAVIILCI